MKITYDITIDDVIPYLVYIYKNAKLARQHKIAINVFGFLFGGALAGLIINSVFYNRPSVALLLVILVPTTIAVVYYEYLLLSKKWHKKEILGSSNVDYIGRHELELTKDEIVDRMTYEEDRVKMSWVKGVKELPAQTMILYGTYQAFIIPHQRIIAGDYEAFMTRFRQVCPQVNND